MKVAILAKGGTISRYPGRREFDDVWALNTMARTHQDIDLLFVMDDLKLRMPFYEGEEFTDWLKTYTKPIITSKAYDEWPTAEEFPIYDCAKKFGLPLGVSMYSSPDYMIAYALMKGYEEIHMFGVDVLEGKLHEMRASTAGWIHTAQALGVKVVVPQGSFFYLYTNVPVVMENGLYGYAHRPRIENLARG